MSTEKFARNNVAGRSLAAGAMLASVVIVQAVPASAATEQVLYSFCSQAGCADGTIANGNLIGDSSGNLFGVTLRGGSGVDCNSDGGCGTLYELSPGQNGQYSYQVIYNFCSLADCADGEAPGGSLILDTSGNLYGTTFTGGGGVGPHGQGEVFELSPNGGTWTLHVLYGFCPGNSCGNDASGPEAGLAYSGQSSGALYDGTSPLFGSAYYANNYADGAVFELQSGQTGWADQVVYDFYSHCTNAAKNKCKDGSGLSAPLELDSAGNIFGTTFEGGKKNLGVAFELAANGRAETVLHSFCADSGCPDGNSPQSGIFQSAAGQFVGMTTYGGYDNTAFCGSPNGGNPFYGCGVVFMESPRGKRGKFTESTLYTFCAVSANCSDGAYPQGRLVFDAQGNIFGATVYGGNSSNARDGGGTIFELTGSALDTLYSFCAQSGCPDGSGPEFGVMRDSSGNLFGVTQGGGANGYGVVYKIVP